MLHIDFLPTSKNKKITELNAFMQEKSPINCNYYNIGEFKKAKFDSSKSFSIFHLNIHSIQKHIEELKTNVEL